MLKVNYCEWLLIVTDWVIDFYGIVEAISHFEIDCSCTLNFFFHRFDKNCPEGQLL